MPSSQFNLDMFQVPMHDLGLKADQLKGILTVGYDENEIKNYMSDYYYDEANVQNQSYNLVESYKSVFRKALARVRKYEKIETALELGAGFGSGTYAMASIETNCKIYATELSTAMLIRHKREGEDKFPQFENRIVRCQVNADEQVFKDESFDLVFGTAILHHVFEPLSVIKEAGRLLKPNGIAIFCEPFEPGYALLRIAYEILLHYESNKRFPFKYFSLTRPQRNYLLHCISVWNANRVDMPHSKDDLKNLDDKWIFPYEYFDETARESGFDNIVKMSNIPRGGNHIERLYNTHTTGNNITLPPIGLEIVKIIDRAFSRPQLECMPHDGVLVLQKRID